MYINVLIMGISLYVHNGYKYIMGISLYVYKRINHGDKFICI